jgi:hypothetical protein
VALRARGPGLRLAADLARLAGPGDRYAGCDEATVVVAAGRYTALICALEARRFGALREIVRRNPAAGHEAGEGAPGEMPGLWLEDAAIQVGLELARTPGSVSPMIELAVDLVRLPLTEQALRDGVLDCSRARLVAALTANLTGELAGAAEARLMAGGWLAGKTWSQILRRLSRIVINLDPDAARKRREAAERFARVVFGAEGDGTARLAGYNLPAGQALQADAQVSARARAYREHGLPGSIELLRAQAFLDILAGLDRRTAGAPGTGSSSRAPGTDGTDGSGPAGEPQHTTDGDGPADSDGDDDAPADGADGDGPADGDSDGADGDGPGGGGNGGGWAGSNGGGGGACGGGFAANVELTIPLATLLGIAERAGSARSTRPWPAASRPGPRPAPPVSSGSWSPTPTGTRPGSASPAGVPGQGNSEDPGGIPRHQPPRMNPRLHGTVPPWPCSPPRAASRPSPASAAPGPAAGRAGTGGGGCGSGTWSSPPTCTGYRGRGAGTNWRPPRTSRPRCCGPWSRSGTGPARCRSAPATPGAVNGSTASPGRTD